MDQLTYEKLTEVFGHLEAEMIESLLEAEGIDVELIQASIEHSSFVTMMGRVQIFVPKDKVHEAREWLKIYRDGIQEE